MRSMFITVEGPIGIGKTSLSQAISHTYGLHLLQEIVYENPFLSHFYQDIAEWSFQTEMFFLCNRYKQLEDIQDKYLQQGKSVVADYNILKNTIFAKRTLTENNLPKYLQIYDILTRDMPQANLVVYLTASLDLVMERIARRDRDMERNMDRGYMQNLIHDYEEYMREFQATYPHIPVLRFDCDALDYVHRSEDLAYVLGCIESYIHSHNKV